MWRWREHERSTHQRFACCNRFDQQLSNPGRDTQITLREIAVDGERGHRSESFEFRNVPGGWYEIRAALVGADGEELAVAKQLVDVETGDGTD